MTGSVGGRRDPSTTAGGITPAGRAGSGVVLLYATLALLALGVVFVFDASYARSMDLRTIGNDGAYFLKRQGLYALVGLAVMFGALRYDYKRLRQMAPRLLALSLLLLILVWVPGIGMIKNGAHRWIGRGAIQFQPSELAKLALIIYMAALLSKGPADARFSWDRLAAPLFIVTLVFLLVEREPDLGTAVVVALTSLTVIYLAGARGRQIGLICAVGFSLIVAAMLLGHSFRLHRILTFLYPESDYYGRGFQVIHGLVAVGSGGLTGVGIGAGREKFYLPEANTDFIFATIAEETGLLGSLVVAGLQFLMAWQGACIARRAPDSFGSLLAGGIAAMMSWQAIINMAVVTGSLPATGVPLPFISYGGTSLVILLAGVGVLLNIAQQSSDSDPARAA